MYICNLNGLTCKMALACNCNLLDKTAKIYARIALCSDMQQKAWVSEIHKTITLFTRSCFWQCNCIPFNTVTTCSTVLRLHLHQSNKKFFGKRTKNASYTYPVHPYFSALLTLIYKMHNWLTLRSKTQPENDFRSRSLKVNLSKYSASLKRSIQFEKLLWLKEVEPNYNCFENIKRAKMKETNCTVREPRPMCSTS